MLIPQLQVMAMGLRDFSIPHPSRADPEAPWEGPLHQAEHLGAHQADENRGVYKGDGDNDVGEAAAEHRHQNHGKYENWKRLHDLQKAHEGFGEGRSASFAASFVKCDEDAKWRT